MACHHCAVIDIGVWIDVWLSLSEVFGEFTSQFVLKVEFNYN